MPFNYSTGNPNNLNSGSSASMTDIKGSFADVKTFLNAKSLDETYIANGTLQKVGLNDGSQVGRGKSIIATTETRSNVAYGTLTTPDRVSGVVLPTDGLLFVAYQATWQNSVAGAGNAAIFVGANQLKAAPSQSTSGTAPVSDFVIGPTTINTDYVLASWSGGLTNEGDTSAAAYTGDVTTGQIVGVSIRNGVCCIFAAAGTYDISVQFKATSGSVTAKNRKLWVWTLGF